MKLLHQVVVLACISASLALPSGTEQKRLIRLSETEDPQWLTEDQIFGLIRKEVNFIDVTNHPSPPLAKHKLRSTLVVPEEVQFRVIVEDLISKLNISRVEEFLTSFTSFHNRYYRADTGVDAANWLYSQILQTYLNSQYKGGVNFQLVEHPLWPQKSIIARLEGSDSTLKSEVVILGAHLDSVNSNNPQNGRSPGADDDGSGSAVLIETFTTILGSDFRPKRTIEFQWYSGEEAGLLGSREIAASYVERSVNVVSMLNFDVVGYYAENVHSIAFTVDLVDPVLTEFLRKVADSYLKYTWINRTCGYACSDYASWNELGFSAASTKQAERNPFMHTEDDSIDIVSFEQIIEFVKLAVGYAVEIAEPQVTQ